MPKKLRWLRSPTGSNGRPWKNWRLSRNRIRCWPGTESSSPTSSTDRSFANPRVVPELTRKPSGWWCGWRRRVPGGAMTGSWAPWPTQCSVIELTGNNSIQRRPCFLDLAQDVFPFGAPYIPFRLFVPHCQELVDRFDQFAYAFETPLPYTVLSQVREEALHQVHPGTACRREVQDDARMSLQPVAHFFVFVRCIVVYDQVQLQL